jgi:Rrf2 family protein
MEEEGVNLSVKTVAEEQGISEKYLEQIIPVLVKNGYIRSVRGAKGGYHLVQDPENYTVGMILRLVEGSIAPVSCLDDEVNQCARCRACATLDLWEQVDQAISNVVDHVSLADLVDRQRRLDARCGSKQVGNC